MSINSDRLAAYLAAETAILEGQEVRFDNGNGPRTWRGADLSEIRDEIRKLQAAVAAEEAAVSGKPVFGGLGFAVARTDCW